MVDQKVKLLLVYPGKAYVRGFEIETMGTTFVDVDKARDFDTENAFQQDLM
ncbi:MAG: hypothetical protein CM15mV8_0220 [Caudoviricetes sp.]|nr:MAG: hypothetical protein CM15mV8_0220 [Caudoviricetes sp.]